MHIDFPVQFDERGRTATTDDASHVRDVLEQLLFTSPGERVNLPDFGCGLLELVFEGNGPQLAETVQYTVKASIERWLGELVEVVGLEVTAEESQLRVNIDYVLRLTGEPQRATYERN